MNAISSRDLTVRALADFDLWRQCSLVRENKERLLLRWVSKEDGPALTPIFSSWLTPFDRIGLLFGSREISLAKICEIAQQVLNSVKDFPLSSPQYRAVQNTVSFLNRKRGAHNLDLLCNYSAPSLIPPITIPHTAFRIRNTVERVIQPACGITNGENKCYLISTLIALCGSEAFKTELSKVERVTDVNVYLRLVFRQLEDTDNSSLRFSQEPLAGLIRELGRVFRPLLNSGVLPYSHQQQDVHEVLLPLLASSFGTTELIRYREVVDRKPPQKPGIFSLLDTVYIPSIDSQSLTRSSASIATTNTLQVHIPKIRHKFPLQMAFCGVPGLENVEPQAILRCEENRGKISPELERILRSGEGLPPLGVIRRQMLCADTPSFLPILAVRFKTYPRYNAVGAVVGFFEEKIKTYVDVPFRLMVPILGGEEQPYELRSVILHLGDTLSHGHYVAALPDLQSARNQSGMPTLWKYYDDGSPVEIQTWEKLSKSICECCYLLLYDKVSVRV